MSKKVVNIIDDEFFKSQDFQDALNGFAEVRKKKRVPLTEYAMKLILKKLHEYSNDNVEIAVKILEQSIELGWQGVFPVKEQDQTYTQQISKRREEL